MKIEKLSVKELAAFISEHLRKCGIDTVLSGGACVTIYTKNKYQSFDLDFVTTNYIKSKKICEAMKQIGFRMEHRHFIHPATKYFIEFPPPPLAVGAEPVKEIREIKVKGKALKLLSPTDCVKDRLSAYYHWNDKQSLHQAVLVYKNQKVDLNEIERWSRSEGMGTKFKAFCKIIQE